MNYEEPITTFQELLKIATAEDWKCEKLLPVSHIPRSSALTAINKDKLLVPSKNNKHYINEELLFFYYGLAKFKPKSIEDLGNDPNPPMVFIFNIQQLLDEKNQKIKATRILPFDSGAFDMYKFEEGYTPRHFEFEMPQDEDILKLVVILFTNTENYLSNKHHFEKVKDTFYLIPKINKLYNMYEAVTKTRAKPDRRAKTFEIHFSGQVQLKPELILFPNSYITSPTGEQQLENQYPGIKRLPYMNESEPDSNLMRINDALSAYLEEKKKEMEENNKTVL